MKIPDVCVLLHATNSSSPDHVVSLRWLDRSLSAGAPVGFAWLVLIGFVRLSTHPRVMTHPLSGDQAMGQVEAWLSARSAHVLHPGVNHAAYLRQALGQVGSAGNLTNDAHLAALAREHKATVVTFDDDFSRFSGVCWERPN